MWLGVLLRVPWLAPLLASIIIGLWSPEESTWTSNVRECLVLLFAIRYIRTKYPEGVRLFIVFLSDNACAVAMATHMYSRAKAIDRIAQLLVKECEEVGAASAGVHVPGVLNVYTDRPSRAGEALYEQVKPSLGLQQWVRERLGLKATAPVGVALPGEEEDRRSRPSVWVVVPKPHTRESELKQAIEIAYKCSPSRVIVVLP